MQFTAPISEGVRPEGSHGPPQHSTSTPLVCYKAEDILSE